MSTLLLFGDTERNAAMRHEIPLAIIDPLMFADDGERRFILTSPIERDRLAVAVPDMEVLDYVALGYRDLIRGGTGRREALRETVVRALEQIGARAVIVPGDFPLALGDHLRGAGIELTVDDDAVDARRRVKSVAELDGIRLAQAAATAGIAAARETLFSAEPGSDGRLWHGGEPLLAEDVRAAIRAACAAAGAPCPPDVMVASAWAGFGHDPGFGPLPAGLPIVVDVWPHHEGSACWGDMTRTFIVGEPRAEHAAELAEMERLVRAALERTLRAIAPGVTGTELFAAVCELFEAAGYPTARTVTAADGDDGFQFALGHGVGLEVHEEPYLGMAGREALVPGDVIAIEPGLHRDGVGMIRIEDLLLVTEKGAENLTDFSYGLGP